MIQLTRWAPLLTTLGILVAGNAGHLWGQTYHIRVDATDLPRKLLRAQITLPVPDDAESHVDLWYPKWVPGSHGPGGPVANLAGIVIRDGASSRELAWERGVGQVHRLRVPIDAGCRRLEISLVYITDQPTTNSKGHDSFGSNQIGLISPGTLLLYADGVDIDEVEVAASLTLPPDWEVATPLNQEARMPDGTITFAPTSMRDYVDSPLLCGRYLRTYVLPTTTDKAIAPAHRLRVVSEVASAVELRPDLKDKFQALVTEAALLFGSHPFDSFDILLGVSDELPRNGLEHSRSSMNVLGQRFLRDPQLWKGWDRLLIPHEYVHAWCGKYRRPLGMIQSDFHSDKDTDLLWVYEGLTQYLGELLEARSGWMTAAEFRHRLETEIRHARLQQGRTWRTLADTGAASHTLRSPSPYWPRLRRSQDYYMEGMLFWLEADAILRDATDGARSIDDFCQKFFHYDEHGPHPRGFTREDIEQVLASLATYDWSGLIQRRVYDRQARFDPEVAHRLGFDLQYSPEPADIPEKTFRRTGGIDALDSLGMTLDAQGKITDVLLHAPAFAAGLGPGMTVSGVNGLTFSKNHFQEAIEQSVSRGEVTLMVVHGERYKTFHIPYDGGPRFLRLVPRKAHTGATIETIVAPRRTP